jgi:hypothetical protein
METPRTLGVIYLNLALVTPLVSESKSPIYFIYRVVTIS